MTKYTPGPWSITPEGITDSNIVAGDTTLATVYDTDLKQGRANLNLMLAAPELLAAAEAMIDVIEVNDEDVSIYREQYKRLKFFVIQAKGSDQ